MTDLDATIRLTAAVAALTEPTVQPLDRSPSATKAARTAADEAHVQRIRRLRAWLVTARVRDDQAGIAHALEALVEAGTAHRDHRAALTTPTATIPSLLDRLHDAVQSSGGAGNGGRGVHRAPLGLDAAELLAHIQRATAHRDGPLADTLRAWRPEDPDHGAALAEQWAVAARAIVEPARRMEAKGACPRCSLRHVWVREGDERVRKAAIQIHVHPGQQARDYAQCINPACDGRWARSHWDLLAAALRADEAG